MSSSTTTGTTSAGAAQEKNSKRLDKKAESDKEPETGSVNSGKGKGGEKGDVRDNGDSGDDSDGSVNSSNSGSSMTEYERLREARIARNESFLASLGLSGNIMRDDLKKRKRVKRPRKKPGPDFVKRSSVRFEGRTFNFKDKNEEALEQRREEQEERKRRREEKQLEKNMKAMERAIVKETKNRLTERDKVIKEFKKTIKDSERDSKRAANLLSLYERKLTNLLNGKSRKLTKIFGEEERAEEIEFARLKSEKLLDDKYCNEEDFKAQFVKAQAEAASNFADLLEAAEETLLEALVGADSDVAVKLRILSGYAYSSGSPSPNSTRKPAPNYHVNPPTLEVRPLAPPEYSHKCKTRPVGSPLRAQSNGTLYPIDRSWLQQEGGGKTDQYVPQAGDRVYYFAKGHRSFLKNHPDLFGTRCKLKDRVPPWLRTDIKNCGWGYWQGVDDNNVPFDYGLGREGLLCVVEKVDAEFGTDLVGLANPINLIVTLKPLERAKGSVPADSFPTTVVSSRKRPAPSTHSAANISTPTKHETTSLINSPPRWKEDSEDEAANSFIKKVRVIANHTKMSKDDHLIRATVMGRDITVKLMAQGKQVKYRAPADAKKKRNRAGRRTTNAFSKSTTLQSSAYEQTSIPPTFDVTFRPTNEADYLIHAPSISTSKNNFDIGERVKMSFGADGIFHGEIVAKKEPSIPQRHIWEGYTVKWDAEANSHDVSAWELLDESTEASQSISGHDSGVDFKWRLSQGTALKLAEMLEVVGQTPEGTSFYQGPPDSTTPNFWDVVPNPISLKRIVSRLKNGYYRNFVAVLDELRQFLDGYLIYWGTKTVSEPNWAWTSKCLTTYEIAKRASINIFATEAILESTASLSTLIDESLTEGRAAVTELPQSVAGADDVSTEWLSITNPDKSWTEREAIAWIPQHGDLVQYSRDKHVEFVSNFEAGLTADGRVIPIKPKLILTNASRKICKQPKQQITPNNQQFQAQEKRQKQQHHQQEGQQHRQFELQQQQQQQQYVQMLQQQQAMPWGLPFNAFPAQNLQQQQQQMQYQMWMQQQMLMQQMGQGMQQMGQGMQQIGQGMHGVMQLQQQQQQHFLQQQQLLQQQQQQLLQQQHFTPHVPAQSTTPASAHASGSTSTPTRTQVPAPTSSSSSSTPVPAPSSKATIQAPTDATTTPTQKAQPSLTSTNKIDHGKIETSEEWETCFVTGVEFYFPNKYPVATSKKAFGDKLPFAKITLCSDGSKISLARTFTVHYRPIAKSAGNAALQFIRPLWCNKLYRKSHKPMGVPSSTRRGFCMLLRRLQDRIISGTDPAFFEGGNTVDSTTVDHVTGAEKRHERLKEAYFGSDSNNDDLRSFTPEHDLSIDRIIERVKNGYYRQISAIENDLIRCFKIRANYRLHGFKDKLQVAVVTQSLVDAGAEVAKYASFMDTLSKMERNAINEVLHARRCFAAAILFVRETNLSEWAFSSGSKSSFEQLRKDYDAISASEAAFNVAHKKLMDTIASEKEQDEQEGIIFGTGREFLPNPKTNENEAAPDLMASTCTNLVMVSCNPLAVYIKVGGIRVKAGILQPSDIVCNPALAKALDFNGKSDPTVDFLKRVGTKKKSLALLGIGGAEKNDFLNTLNLLIASVEEQRKILVESTEAVVVASKGLKETEALGEIVVTAADVAEMVMGDLGGWEGEEDVHEDYCLVCESGGDLIMCDGCPNCAHLECVGLEEIGDEEEWFCPACISKIVSSEKFKSSKGAGGGGEEGKMEEKEEKKETTKDA